MGVARCSPVPWLFPPRSPPRFPSRPPLAVPGRKEGEHPEVTASPLAGRCGEICKVFFLGGSSRSAAARPSRRDALGRGGGVERPGRQAALTGPVCLVRLSVCLSVPVWVFFLCVCVERPDPHSLDTLVTHFCSHDNQWSPPASRDADGLNCNGTAAPRGLAVAGASVPRPSSSSPLPLLPATGNSLRLLASHRRLIKNTKLKLRDRLTWRGGGERQEGEGRAGDRSRLRGLPRQ